MPVYDYQPAVLKDYDGDLSKRWYVEYYAFDKRTGTVKRFRQYEPINREKTYEDRLSVGLSLVRKINSKLFNGHVVGNVSDRPGVSPIKSGMSFASAVDEFVEKLKRDNHSPNYIRRFPIIMSLWRQWRNIPEFSDLALGKVNTAVIESFLTHLQTSRSIGNKTYNNYRTDLRTFFNWVIKTIPDQIKINPVDPIKSLRTVATKHAAFSDMDMKRIKAKCEEFGYTELLFYIQFLYNSLVRPGELLQMKIGMIELNEKRLFIPGEISKNDNDDYIPIAPALKKAILNSKLLDLPKDYYIFGKLGQPGIRPSSADFFRDRNTKVLKALNLTDKKYSIYSYKHSGAIAMYKHTKDIKLLQSICRHKSVDQTDAYLRDLGVLTDYDALDDFSGALYMGVPKQE